MIDFNNIYSESFDTFKVFDGLAIEQASTILPNMPKTVWQILNHLIVWQKYNTELLEEAPEVQAISESETWSVSPIVTDQKLLDKTVKIFEDQIAKIKHLIGHFNSFTNQLEFKLKTVQEIVTHLSFHIGEIILIRRQMGNYPMPDEMSAFLNHH